MRKFDLTLVGNGSISYVAALKIKKAYPHLSISIVGPKNKPYNASLAAGAMHAVFCEVEDTLKDSARDQQVFKLALESRASWKEFLDEFQLNQIVTADSTIMYRRKKGTPFEVANFEAACSMANDYQCLEDVSQSELETLFCGKLKSTDVIAKKFVGEFGFDVYDFFVQTEKRLKEMGVELVDQKALKVEKVGQETHVQLIDGTCIASNKVIVAAGSYSADLLPADFPMVPLYHAVGSAMSLDSAPSSYQNLRYVVRTPNRGGAQCGMHIVPRNYGRYYLGAGNYLSDSEPAHRIETLRYLIDMCETELYGKQCVYNTKAEVLLGSRPKSMDGYPIVGTCSRYPEIFVATGTYRIGLSLSPVLADEMCMWLDSGKCSEKISNWAPDRDPHSYGTLEAATRYYSESRISNLIEHNLLDIDDEKAIAEKKIELVQIANDLNDKVVKKMGLPAGYVVEPDMYAILASV